MKKFTKHHGTKAKYRDLLLVRLFHKVFRLPFYVHFLFPCTHVTFLVSLHARYISCFPARTLHFLFPCKHVTFLVSLHARNISCFPARRLHFLFPCTYVTFLVSLHARYIFLQFHYVSPKPPNQIWSPSILLTCHLHRR
jgi:hypothetical protein